MMEKSFMHKRTVFMSPTGTSVLWLLCTFRIDYNFLLFVGVWERELGELRLFPTNTVWSSHVSSGLWYRTCPPSSYENSHNHWEVTSELNHKMGLIWGFLAVITLDVTCSQAIKRYETTLASFSSALSMTRLDLDGLPSRYDGSTALQFSTSSVWTPPFQFKQPGPPIELWKWFLSRATPGKLLFDMFPVFTAPTLPLDTAQLPPPVINWRQDPTGPGSANDPESRVSL